MNVQKPSKTQLAALIIIMVLTFYGGMMVGGRRQAEERAAAGLLAVIEEEEPTVEVPPIDKSLLQPALELPELAVHVKGAVEKPGLYELPAGSRVADALLLAILLPQANTDIINLAALLNDSAEVVVPYRIEGEQTDWEAVAVNAAAAHNSVSLSTGITGASGSNVVASTSSLVNLNTADQTALLGLSGIGPVKAQAIIDYREQNGPFAKIEDVKKVSGIGQATYDNIKNYICVE